MIGRTLGHYQVLEEIGRGGMGVVRRAEDLKLKRIAALKFLHPDPTRDPEALARFTQKAQAAAALNHANICNVYEIDEAEGQTFVAMAEVEGQTLKENIETGPLDIGQAVDIAVQAAEGLHAAHARGVIHRDIKPGNIMLTDQGLVKIMDFGMANANCYSAACGSGEQIGPVFA